MDILRFITAGSVDDGKSTLIGRLLYDSKSILIDQLEAIEKQSKNKAEGEIDLALLTDGLRAEREQGITILVDARNGVVEQTRRHSIITSLLNIPHVVVAINKMDLVNYSEDVYNNIVI